MTQKFAMCWNPDGTTGLFFADKNGSHYGKRIAVVENQDYADLIQAAPELLAILKKCLKDELARRKKLLNESTAACYADFRIAKMKAVIAKVEGK